MQRLALPGHYGSERRDRRLRQLRPGLVRRHRDRAPERPRPARADRHDGREPTTCRTSRCSRTPRCPRCAGRLKTVHNQSRWGRSVQLQCLKRDGAYQSFAQFLEEKGLLRPMSRLDRAKLLRDRGRIDCVNCGAAIGKRRRALPLLHARCRACSTSPGWRGRSIRRRMLEAHAVHATAGAAAGDAVRRLRRRPAAGRDDELRPVRRDARHPEPARGLRRGREARAGAEGERRASRRRRS